MRFVQAATWLLAQSRTLLKQAQTFVAKSRIHPIVLFTVVALILMSISLIGHRANHNENNAHTAVSAQHTAVDNKNTQTHHRDKQATKQSDQANRQTSKQTVAQALGIADNDWRIILVNRKHPTAELSPQLATMNVRCAVDSRIATPLTQFLAAAQSIDPNQHYISCYRSVAYQADLFESYVDTAMSSQGMDRQQAEAYVETFSQPAGTSEHQTGLAVDISSMESMNTQDAAIARKIQRIAPQYGFVLRFPEGKHDITGIEYEDWHYRYVGPEIAQYMTAQGWTLEELVANLNNPAQ